MIMSWGEGLLCLTAFVSSNCDFGSFLPYVAFFFLKIFIFIIIIIIIYFFIFLYV